MRRDMTGQDRIGWDRLERDGTGCDGMGCDATLHNATGLFSMGLSFNSSVDFGTVLSMYEKLYCLLVTDLSKN